jgi:hypothetical protein
MNVGPGRIVSGHFADVGTSPSSPVGIPTTLCPMRRRKQGSALPSNVKASLALVAFLALASLAASPSGASAAKSEIQPAEEHFGLILEHKRPGSRPDLLEGTHVLFLNVYPLRGIAVASTASNNYDIENNESVVYVEPIPKGMFDGHLDLHFKGLGDSSVISSRRKPSRNTSQRAAPGRGASPRSATSMAASNSTARATRDGHRPMGAPSYGARLVSTAVRAPPSANAGQRTCSGTSAAVSVPSAAGDTPSGHSCADHIGSPN